MLIAHLWKGTLMYVSNWRKWTRAKKQMVFACYVIGFALAFSIEKEPIWWGIIGIGFCSVGVLIMSTIRYDDW